MMQYDVMSLFLEIIMVIAVYIGEIVLKIIGFGPHHYYRKPWNV